MVTHTYKHRSKALLVVKNSTVHNYCTLPHIQYGYLCREVRPTNGPRDKLTPTVTVRDVYEKATCYNRVYATVLFVSGTGYSKMLWAHFSMHKKAVLHLKCHQFYCFTLSQQRIVFNKISIS